MIFLKRMERIKKIKSNNKSSINGKNITSKNGKNNKNYSFDKYFKINNENIKYNVDYIKDKDKYKLNENKGNYSYKSSKNIFKNKMGNFHPNNEEKEKIYINNYNKNNNMIDYRSKDNCNIIFRNNGILYSSTYNYNYKNNNKNILENKFNDLLI